MNKKVLCIKLLIQISIPVFLVFGFFVPVHSQVASSQFTFDIFTQEDGLPNNQIQCIYQDKKGWMWIGTSQGLSRFDGYSFVNFLPNANDTNSINGNLVRVIKEDKNGNLLVGTENGGLDYFDYSVKTFANYQVDENDPNSLNNNSIHSVYQDKSGNVWVGTYTGGVNVIKKNTKKL